MKDTFNVRTLLMKDTFNERTLLMKGHFYKRPLITGTTVYQSMKKIYFGLYIVAPAL